MVTRNCIYSAVRGEMQVEVASTLQNLIRKMQEFHLKFSFLNLPHDKPYVGTPATLILKSEDLTDVRLEKGNVVFESKDVIFRIYGSKKEENPAIAFLKWARAQLAKLTDDLKAGIRIIVVPDWITFFSTSTQPLRQPIPVFTGRSVRQA